MNKRNLITNCFYKFRIFVFYLIISYSSLFSQTSSMNMELLVYLPAEYFGLDSETTKFSDIWGYVKPENGNEYAIIGIWGNEPVFINTDDPFTSTLYFGWNNLQLTDDELNNYQIIDFGGNINLSPEFTNEESQDYDLGQNSPCIDAGTDFYVFDEDTILNLSSDNYFGNAPDMGALEFNPENVLGIENDLMNSPEDHQLIYAYPNPFNPILNINLDVEKEGQYSIHIYDIKGQFLETVHNGYLSSSVSRFKWNASIHSSGIYFVKIQSGDKMVTHKILLLK